MNFSFSLLLWPSGQLRSTKLAQLLFALCLFFALPGLSSQDASQGANLKRSFGGVALGESLEQVKEALGSSPYFLYNSNIPVLDIPGRKETLLEVGGSGWIKTGQFQFTGDQLTSINLVLAENWLSYEEVYQKLLANYGNPKRFSPQRALWENDQTLITLEKNLYYKIIDKSSLELPAESTGTHSFLEINRDAFLNEF